MRDPDSALEAEIDLLDLLGPVIKKVWWIIGIALGVAILAYLASRFAVQEKYESEASLLIGTPRLNANLDNRLEISQPTLDARAIPNVAMSNDLLTAVYETMGASEDKLGGLTFGEFREGLSVSMAGNIVRLQVTDVSPERAAEAANAWAEALQTRLAELYGVSESTADELDRQAGLAKAQYEVAEKALLDYLPQSRAAALSIQYSTAQLNYSNQLSGISAMDLLLTDLRGLDARLAAVETSSTLGSNDSLELAALQRRTIDALLPCLTRASLISLPDVSSADPALPSNASPGQSQVVQDCYAGITSGELLPRFLRLDPLASPLTAADARDAVGLSIDAIETRRLASLNLATKMEGQVADLSTQLEEAQNALAEITRTRDLGLATYRALSNQAASLRIELASSVQPAQIISSAVPARGPSSPRVVLNTAAAGVLGFALAALGVFALDWWTRVPERRE